MPDAHDTVDEKVRAIFREAFGDRSDRLHGDKPAFDGLNAMQKALTDEWGLEVADQIAFNLAECNWNAAFIAAVCLFPERFTDEELRAGIDMLLIDAPDHFAAAAVLAGKQITDVFEVGVPEKPREET